MRLVRDLLEFRPTRRGTNIAQALDFAGRILHRRAIVFVVSDFIDESYRKPLRVLSGRHDVVAVSVTDPLERELPDVGLVELQDAETGQRMVLDTSSPKARERYLASTRKSRDELDSTLKQLSIDEIRVSAGDDYVRDILAFCRRRERRQ